MSQKSVRLILPDIHNYDDEPPLPVPESKPSTPEGGGFDGPEGGTGVGRLGREGDMVVYAAEGMDPAAVRVVWALPLSSRPGPVSIMLAGKKKELLYLDSLDRLDPESRKIAEEELAGRVVLPRVTQIYSVWPRFGNYYWDVETDRGRRKFLLVSPENNSQYIGPDAVVVRDVSGNSYEINPVSGLDRKSFIEFDKVL